MPESPTQVKSIMPAHADHWKPITQRPKDGNLYYILYQKSGEVRLAMWKDHGPLGNGFYCATELPVLPTVDRQAFRIEPAIYVIPDAYQLVKGLHSIMMFDRL